VNVRRPTPADLHAVLGLLHASDASVYGDSDWTEGDLRHDWDKATLEQDAWIVELDGRLAGYALFEHRPNGHLVGDGYVHPDLRGRGVGTELLRLTEERAWDALPAGDAGALHNATLAGDPAAPPLYAANGYRPVRHFWKMVGDVDQAPALRRIEGIEIERYRHPEDARALHAARNEAFAEEWGFRPPTFDEFAERHFEATRFDPALWWVARDRGEIAGFAICEWKRNGDWGWVAALGVRAPWRRRGIGEALLLTAFAEFARRGERRVALGVDAGNPTGATRLYERVGMRVLWEAVVYEKELRRP
jgi:mycothiol synthase